MTQPFSSREDLKRDLFQERVQQSLEWIAQHRQTFFSIVGTIVVTILVIAFVITNWRNVRTQAWERFTAGQNWMNARDFDKALGLFDEVITNYSHTPAAIFSLLAKGDILYRQGKISDAVGSYKLCLEKKPSRVLLPFVLANLGMAQEDGGDFSSAIETYKQFTAEYSEHYLAPKIYESLARSYELQLNPDAAKEIYEKIITKFPETIWAEKARQRYQVLTPQPFQTTPNAPPAPASVK